MGKPVEFDDVVRHMRAFGEVATLITVADDGRPHVGTSVVATADERLVVEVGPRTRGHLEQRPTLTLLWEPAPGGDYQLIVDGTATSLAPADDRGVTSVAVSTERGILHRLAGLTADGPSCRELSE